MEAAFEPLFLFGRAFPWVLAFLALYALYCALIRWPCKCPNGGGNCQAFFPRFRALSCPLCNRLNCLLDLLAIAGQFRQRPPLSVQL
jgi:hypothetical protein